MLGLNAELKTITDVELLREAVDLECKLAVGRGGSPDLRSSSSHLVSSSSHLESSSSHLNVIHFLRFTRQK